MATNWRFRVEVFHESDGPMTAFNFRSDVEAYAMLHTLQFAEIWEASLFRQDKPNTIAVVYGLKGHDPYAQSQIDYRISKIKAAMSSHEEFIALLEEIIDDHPLMQEPQNTAQ